MLSVNIVKGEIESCKIQAGSSGTSKFGGKKSFVGLKFESNGEYLRWNPSGKEFDKIRAACSMNMYAEVKYKAQRTILRPELSLWVEEIVVSDVNLIKK